MARTKILACIAVIGGTGILMSSSAISQSGIKNYVFLQPTSPGVSQSGHSNVSGNSRASQFIGGGGGLTNLNANQLTFGTVPNQRLSGTYGEILTLSNAGNQLSGDGAGLTGLNAASLATGIIASARIAGTYSGITGVGTLTTGTWQGATIAAGFGGTGHGTYVAGDILVATGPATLSRLPIGSNGQVLGVAGSGLAWTTNSATLNVPVLLVGSEPNYILQAENSSATSGGAAVRGFHSATSSQVYGGLFTSASSSGSGVFGVASSASGLTYGVRGESSGSSGRGVSGRSLATTGVNYGVYGEITGGSGAGVYGTSGSLTDGISVYGRGTGAGATAVLGESTGSTGTGIGVKGESRSASGIGVWGEATGLGPGAYGGFFVTPDNSFNAAVFATGRDGVIGAAITSGVGVKGVAGSATPSIGVLGESSANGSAAIRANATGENGNGVYARASNPTGFSQGVYGINDSVDGIGVRGTSTATSGTPTGGYFESEAPNGRAVEGYANNATGASAGGHFVNGSATSNSYGVYGQAPVGNNRYGVFANGTLGASGVKTFRIDNPRDPANQYLLHYSSESPYPQNFYNGSVTTDGKGYAWVDLPDYFADINANFKYQLTVVEDVETEEFVLVKVIQKIKGTRFRIKTSVPNTEVSWMVFADRDDPLVRLHGPRDVIEKTGAERGRYQNPELYGAPKELGTTYRAPRPRSNK